MKSSDQVGFNDFSLKGPYDFDDFDKPRLDNESSRDAGLSSKNSGDSLSRI